MLSRVLSGIGGLLGIRQGTPRAVDAEIAQGVLEQPTVTVLVIDHSGSMVNDDFPPSRLQAAVGAGLNYIEARARVSRSDKVGAVVFCDHAHVVLDPVAVEEARRLWKKRTGTIEADSGTSLRSGLEGAVELLRAQGRSGIPLTRRIVMLTDGHGGDPSDYADVIKRDGVVIDTIGIGGTPDDVNEEVLRRIASVSDGRPRYRFITSSNDLFSYFSQIATDLVKVEPQR